MNISQSIIHTLSFFDVFDYPLTRTEIFKYLYSQEVASHEVIYEKLCELTSAGVIEFDRGVYFFSGRGDIVLQRLFRYEEAHGKFHKALKAAKILSRIPWIRGIAVCNSLAYSNASKDSDIDLFIITEKNKIWTSRFFAAGIMELLDLRPKDGSKKDKICLSFYVSDENMDLSSIAIENDIYLTYWLAGLVPLFERGEIFSQFYAQNPWLRHQLVNWYPYKTSDRRYFSKPQRKFWSKGVGLERFFEKMQRKIMPDILKTSDDVILNNQMLKLYSREKRAHYRDQYRENVNTYSLENIYVAE